MCLFLAFVKKVTYSITLDGFYLFFFLNLKEVGVEFTEMNASDTRGRKALDSIIKESLSNTSVTGMLQGNGVSCLLFLILEPL